MIKILNILTLLILLFSCDSYAQVQPPLQVDTSIFSLTPSSKHKVVNGIAIGLTAHPWSIQTDTIFVKINGVNIELAPLGIIGGIWGTMLGFIGVKNKDGKRTSFFSNDQKDSLFSYYPKYGTHLNGLSISVGGTTETFNNGIIINGISGVCYEINGLQISGLINIADKLNGVSIALLANNARIAKGIQVGLINKCQTGNVLQIGLFNRIGKRVTPFINLRFKKKTKPNKPLASSEN